MWGWIGRGKEEGEGCRYQVFKSMKGNVILVDISFCHLPFVPSISVKRSLFCFKSFARITMLPWITIMFLFVHGRIHFRVNSLTWTFWVKRWGMRESHEPVCGLFSTCTFWLTLEFCSARVLCCLCSRNSDSNTLNYYPTNRRLLENLRIKVYLGDILMTQPLCMLWNMFLQWH